MIEIKIAVKDVTHVQKLKWHHNFARAEGITSLKRNGSAESRRHHIAAGECSRHERLLLAHLRPEVMSDVSPHNGEYRTVVGGHLDVNCLWLIYPTPRP